jgi:WD40 repeat protein
VSIWPSEWVGAAPKPIELRGLTTPALTVQFSPDSGSLVATGLNPAYWSWNLRSHPGGKQPSVIGREQAPEAIHEFAASPARDWFAAACAKRGEVKLFAADGCGEWVIGKHVPDATGVAFDPRGRWLASGGVDGTIKVWEMGSLAGAIETGMPIPGPRHVLDVSDARIQYSRRVAFHPRGTLYATCGDGLLFEWDLNADDPGAGRKAYEIHSIQFMLADVEISPDGKYMAVVRHGNDSEPKPGETQFGNMVLVFDVSASGPPVPIAELRSAAGQGATNLDFSSDSRWLAVSGAGEAPRVWDLQATDIEASRRSAPVATQIMAGVAFSPNGETLALAGSDGRIHLWDWQGAGRPRSISTGAAIVSLAWVDGTRLASAGEAGRIEVWETDLATLKAEAREIAGRKLSVEERRRFRIQH